MVLFKKINVDEKQDKLTAGTNITIADNVISASGGATGNFVTLDTGQSITGAKTFTKYCYFLRPIEVGEPTLLTEATTKQYVDTNLALKADKLVVPINASADTSTTINDRVVKVVYKEFTSTGDSVVASTTAGFGYLNASIIRKKSDNSWGIVYNDEFNEVYIDSSSQIRFNIKTLAGYTANIKILVEYT